MKIFVEFIPKSPRETSNDKFLSVDCETLEQAIIIEKKFHDIGWVARVVSLESIRQYLTAGV